MLIHENFNLQPHNSFGVSANSRYFSSVSSLEQIRQAFQFASEKRIPTYVLGEGSNILFSRDFPGLIIKIAFLKSFILFQYLTMQIKKYLKIN